MLHLDLKGAKNCDIDIFALFSLYIYNIYHVNESDNPLIQVFSESLEMLGLKQMVKEFTHRNGNILDVVITENSESNINMECHVDEFISNHRFVQLQMEHKKLEQCLKKLMSEI